MTRPKERFKQANRMGSVLVEGVIAMVFLVTSVTALSRYAVASRQLSRKADLSLAARINSQNAIGRLALTPAQEWPIAVDTIAAELTTASGVSTKIRLREFRVGDANALHATVRCQIESTDSEFVENHTWKIMP